MKLKRIISTSVIALGMIHSVFADDVTIVGSVQRTLKQSNADHLPQGSISGIIESEKIIQLLKIELSEQEKAFLLKQSEEAKAHTHQFSKEANSAKNSLLPEKIALGMNKVPVLDQGIHGTCVTFAITGAIDAVIKQGDYISQLCSLQLGSYLENHGHGASGWDGANTYNIINQMTQYGLISKSKQHKTGCGGLYHYPTRSSHSSTSFIEPEQYSTMSEPVFGKIVNWSDINYPRDKVLTLDNVKQALNSGDRVVFGVMLPRDDLGTAGAVGKHKTWFFKDTWLLTPEILAGVGAVNVGHEMVITGYDDNAVAVDNHGEKHKGLLILRNSWNIWLGDWGDFYMSYDYFKLLAFDVKRISPNA